MTPDEEAKFFDFYVKFKQDGQRKGQALMNALGYVAPELYDMVTGTLADCFYRDDRIPAFRDMIGV